MCILFHIMLSYISKCMYWSKGRLLGPLFTQSGRIAEGLYKLHLHVPHSK